ncbi:hypothetical protein [Salinicola lusitanus]|uniref:hypothetical protein n=1 Tax=Salinicola lusitanus TaxID=1949085 RepID=UPI0013003677|nr:hypothetical protein [Salinicola lusitanus]
MKRIVAMLGEAGRKAGKRRAADRLLLKSLEVYQYFVKESDISDDKVRGVAKIVVSDL